MSSYLTLMSEIMFAGNTIAAVEFDFKDSQSIYVDS